MEGGGDELKSNVLALVDAIFRLLDSGKGSITRRRSEAHAVVSVIVEAAHDDTLQDRRFIKDIVRTAFRTEYLRCRVISIVEAAARLFHSETTAVTAEQALATYRDRMAYLERWQGERNDFIAGLINEVAADTRAAESAIKKWGAQRYMAIENFKSRTRWLDDRFWTLPDEAVYGQLARLKPDRPSRGPDSAEPFRVAATLSAKCNAFGDTDADEATRAFRSAWTKGQRVTDDS